MGNTGVTKAWWHRALIAACILLAATLSACGASEGHDATGEKVLALEAKVHSLEESLEAQREENTTLQWELIDLRQRQADYFREQEAAKITDRIEREAATDFGDRVKKNSWPPSKKGKPAMTGVWTARTRGCGNWKKSPRS